MPTASITVNTTPREAGQFTVIDTSDYTGAITVDSTDLEVTDPDNNVYNIDIFPENFATINGTYVITPSLLGLTEETFKDGVWSFQFTATIDGGTILTAPLVYLLMDITAKTCWVDMFENCIKNGDCFSDEEKDKRTDIREFIQAAEEHFGQFRYTSATTALTEALRLCENKCDC